MSDWRSKLGRAQKNADLAVRKTNKKMEKLRSDASELIDKQKELSGQSKSKLEEAQETTDLAIKKTNRKIEYLGEETNEIFQVLTKIQNVFDSIRNVPTDKKLELTELKKVRINWKDQVDKIEEDYQHAAAKGAGMGALGTGAGIAVAALGSSVAMGIATTFGVASTGTAISALSGAAATNAALAWLGGGVLATGGGGMVAGNLLLALTGPIGWAVAGAAILGGGGLFLRAKNEKEHLENIFTLISIRDAKSYSLAIIELNERITRIISETKILEDAVNELKHFGLNYEQMSNQQQHQLGTYVNFMHSSTQLLVNPILGLQPKYSKDDYIDFLSDNQDQITEDEAQQSEEVIIFLANLLYKIDLDNKDEKIIWKAIQSNEELMQSMNLSKEDFKPSVMEEVDQALKHEYQWTDF